MSQAALEANRANAKLGGRPKGFGHLARQHIVDLARKRGPEAIEVLTWEMRNSDNPAIRVACARELLDRGYGKPTHKLEASSAGAMLNMLQVISGVPRPDPEEKSNEEPEEMIGEEELSPVQIEGEIVKE